MVWTTKADVARHNKQAANDPSLRKQWKAVANGHLKEHPEDKAGAIKIANGVIRKRVREDFNPNVISDKEIMNEFNFRSLGHNIANSVLKNLGSNKAAGRLDRQHTIDSLMGEFNTYLGHQQSKPTQSAFLGFLRSKFGDDYAVNVQKQFVAGTFGSTPPQEEEPAQAAPAAAPAAGGAVPSAAAPAGPKQMFKNANLNARANDVLQQKTDVKNDTQFYSDKAKQAGVSKGNRSYQGNTYKELSQLIAQPKPDARQIITLTKEILAHANDFGGNDKARVMAYLKNLRKNPNIQRNPKLSGMFNNLKLESIHKSLDMAIYLVENDIKTKKALTETYRLFLTERPFGKAANASNRPVYDNGMNRYGRPAPAAPASPQAAAPAAGPAPTQAGQAAGANDLRARYNARFGAGNSAATSASANPNRLLSRKELMNYFGVIAGQLLASNSVDFTKKGEGQYRKMANGRYEPVTEPSINQAQHSASASTARLDTALLSQNLRMKGMDGSPEGRIIFELGKKGYNMRQILAQLKKEGINPSHEAMEALHDAWAGQKSVR